MFHRMENGQLNTTWVRAGTTLTLQGSSWVSLRLVIIIVLSLTLARISLVAAAFWTMRTDDALDDWPH